jgi:hypothetical protein
MGGHLWRPLRCQKQKAHVMPAAAIDEAKFLIDAPLVSDLNRLSEALTSINGKSAPSLRRHIGMPSLP